MLDYRYIAAYGVRYTLYVMRCTSIFLEKGLNSLDGNAISLAGTVNGGDSSVTSGTEWKDLVGLIGMTQALKRDPIWRSGPILLASWSRYWAMRQMPCSMAVRLEFTIATYQPQNPRDPYTCMVFIRL